jgi:hypothetical protein
MFYVTDILLFFFSCQQSSHPGLTCAGESIEDIKFEVSYFKFYLNRAQKRVTNKTVSRYLTRCSPC